MITLGVFHNISIDDTPYLYTAKIDTGAFSSSIDKRLAEVLELPKVVMGTGRTFKSTLGKDSNRDFITARIKFLPNGDSRNIIFSVTDRSELQFKILIGRRDLYECNVIISDEESDPNNPLNVKRNG